VDIHYIQIPRNLSAQKSGSDRPSVSTAIHHASDKKCQVDNGYDLSDVNTLCEVFLGDMIDDLVTSNHHAEADIRDPPPENDIAFSMDPMLTETANLTSDAPFAKEDMDVDREAVANGEHISNSPEIMGDRPQKADGNGISDEEVRDHYNITTTTKTINPKVEDGVRVVVLSPFPPCFHFSTSNILSVIHQHGFEPDMC
jgi:hypothetical protein